MKVYQFIKYNQKTETDHIKNYRDNRIIICFDFEDGIQNCFDHEKTILLKEAHRDYFASVISKFQSDIKIGVRINSTDRLELQKDILKIKNINIHSIFLPKIESTNEIAEIIAKLDDNKISYKEIIPIIESKKGLINIKNIVGESDIRNIAFGHCDYNMSLNILPFFHHENFEYWKWVNELISNTKHKNICFINSPYLTINKDCFFSSMIEHLKILSENNFGQITLSNAQTELCLINTYCDVEFNSLLSNRHQLYPTHEYLDDLILDYEKFNTGKGLSKSRNRIISIQEYICAKKFKSQNTLPKIKVAFVGGCFPVQHDILFEDIFLSKTKLLIENEISIDLQIDIIRYERFSNVLEKIKKSAKSKHFDLLIFSIRPEPFFRLIKFYYKYINNKGKLKHSLNLPALNWVNPEKYDLLLLGRRFNYSQNSQKSRVHKFLVDANYLSGRLIGNKSYAIRKYIELIRSIQKSCDDTNIQLILIGPNQRANTKQEPQYCKELDIETRNAFPLLTYINGFDVEYESKTVFQENGIHVNKLYHNLIAERIFNVLKNKLLSPIMLKRDAGLCVNYERIKNENTTFEIKSEVQ